MKILAVLDASLARSMYPKDDVDVTEIKPSKKRRDYDVVFANQVLPRVSYRESLNAIKTWAECLKKGGSLHVLVPSLEWAAERILSNTPPLTIPAIYGSQNNGEFFISGYTMNYLRDLFAKAELQVTQARSGTQQIGDDEMEIHLIVGVK